MDRWSRCNITTFSLSLAIWNNAVWFLVCSICTMTFWFQYCILSGLNPLVHHICIEWAWSGNATCAGTPISFFLIDILMCLTVRTLDLYYQTEFTCGIWVLWIAVVLSKMRLVEYHNPMRSTQEAVDRFGGSCGIPFFQTPPWYTRQI